MVTTVSTYTCELCGRVHKTLEKAEACEAQGVPVTEIKVGDYVTAGGGHYGWWGADRSFCLVAERDAARDDHLGPRWDADGAIYCQHPGTPGPTSPGRQWFVEIWRVAAIEVSAALWGEGVHRLRFALWNPRHPNVGGGTERLTETYSQGHKTPMRVGDPNSRIKLAGPFLPPALTKTEEARFEEIRTALLAGGIQGLPLT